MAIPTDRGYLQITTDAAGTSTVMIGTGLSNGEVQNVYAEHVRGTKLELHPGVRMADGKHGSHSLDVVEVSVGDDNTLHVWRVESTDDLRAQR